MKFHIEIDGQDYAIDLPEKTLRALAQMVVRNDLSLEAVFQQAIENENWLETQEDDGARLLIRRGNTIRELVRERICS